MTMKFSYFNTHWSSDKQLVVHYQDVEAEVEVSIKLSPDDTHRVRRLVEECAMKQRAVASAAAAQIGPVALMNLTEQPEEEPPKAYSIGDADDIPF